MSAEVEWAYDFPDFVDLAVQLDEWADEWDSLPASTRPGLYRYLAEQLLEEHRDQS